MDFDYNSIRYIHSEAELSGNFLILTQTYFLENEFKERVEYKEKNRFFKGKRNH